MGKLTTHILDTMNGIPAAGMVVELSFFSEGCYQHIKTTSMNKMGRSDKPMLNESEFAVGKWELMFHVADYFAKINLQLSEPAFLDVIPIRFGIASIDEHYHVPLLVTPWSYSTYRGS